MEELTLVPAYGRDYRTVEALIADWKGGKDFKVATAVSRWSGKFTSIRDLSTFPGEHVKIRFNKVRNYVLIRISDGHITWDKDLVE